MHGKIDRMCAGCLEQIYNAKLQRESHHTKITRFLCPECRTENSVETGKIDNFKVNYPVKRAVEVLRGFEERHQAPSNKKARLCEPCPHAAFLSTSKMTTCQHCSEAFCKTCLFTHLELMKLEINFITNRFGNRFSEAVSRLPEKAEAIRRQIDANLSQVQESIATSSEALIESVRRAILENRDRLSQKAQELAAELREKLEKETEIGDFSRNKQAEIEELLTRVNKKSVLFSGTEEFSRLHQLVIEQDLKVSKWEEIDQGEIATSRILFNSNSSTIAKLVKLLGKVSDVAMETKLENINLEPVAHAYEELHSAAKSGNFEKLKSIFERNDPSWHQLIVEHGDTKDLHRTVLLQCAKAGSLDAVRYLLTGTTEIGANLSARDDAGDLATHLAARSGHTEIVKFLLDSMSRSNFVDEKGLAGQTLLFIASKDGNIDLVRFLVDVKVAKIEADNSAENCYSPLMIAAKMGHLEIVKILVERGANVLSKSNISSKSGDTALHLAASFGKVEIVKCLLEKNPEMIDLPRSHDNRTPLCLAASNGQLSVVEFLLTGAGSSTKANLEHVDRDGNIPLLLAAETGSLPVFQCLFSHYANLYAKNAKNSESVFLRVAAKGFVELARFLVEKDPELLTMPVVGADVTPFQYAVNENNFDMVKCLVEIGLFRVFNPNEFLSAVEKPDRLQIVRYLVENDGGAADLLARAVDVTGRNVLRRALWSQDDELIEYLISVKPELINEPDTKGETPLQAAERYRAEESICVSTTMFALMLAQKDAPNRKS